MMVKLSSQRRQMRSPSSGKSSTNLSVQNCQFHSKIEEVEIDIDVGEKNVLLSSGGGVYVLIGGKCSFKATFLAAGEETRIKIKSDYREATLLLSST